MGPFDSSAGAGHYHVAFAFLALGTQSAKILHRSRLSSQLRALLRRPLDPATKKGCRAKASTRDLGATQEACGRLFRYCFVHSNSQP